MIVFNPVKGDIDFFPDFPDSEPPFASGASNQYLRGNKIFAQVDYSHLANSPFITGAGDPNGAVIAPVGRMYAQFDASGSSVFWGKVSGTGGSGWRPMADISSAQVFTNKTIDFAQNTALNIPLSAIEDFEGSTVALNQPAADSLLWYDLSGEVFDWSPFSAFARTFLDNITGDSIVDSRTKRGLLTTVYLAARTDGKAGSGTAEDPFDCGIASGQAPADAATKFDTLMASFPANTYIHLGAGIFYTVIIPKAWGIKPGWTIEGRGEPTEIKGIGSLASGGWRGVLGVDSIYYPGSSGATIRNLRINCNWPELATTAPIGAGGYTAIGGTTTITTPNVWFAYTTVPTGVSPTEHDTITVGSTTGFPASGTIYMQHSDGFMPITYQSKTSSTFVNCTGHSGTIPAGAYVSTVKLLFNEQFARTLAGTGVGTGRTVLRIPSTTIQPPSAAIASGSNGAVLPQGTINLNDASSFPGGGGTVTVVKDLGGAAITSFTYTSKSGNALLGCTGGSGTLSTGMSVFFGSALPQGTLYVGDTTDFSSAGLLLVQTSSGPFRVVKYTGKTSTTFTGCTGGTGSLEPDMVVYSPHQMVMSANATASGLVDITFGGERDISLGAITLQGRRCTLDGVHALWPHGSAANSKESFCMGVSTTAREAPHYENRYGDFNEIKNCIVEGIYGNYGNPFLVAGGPFKIHDNFAFGVNNGFTQVFNSGGVNMAYITNGEIYNNTFVDCVNIAYIDTGYCHGLKVYNNTLIRGSAAVGVVNTVANNDIEIYGNTIGLQNRTFSGHSYGFVLNNGTYTNCTIHDNKVTFEHTGFGYDHFYNIAIGGWASGAIYDNILAAGSDNEPGLLTGVRVSNNRLPSGASLSTFPDNVAINAQSLDIGGGNFTVAADGTVTFSGDIRLAGGQNALLFADSSGFLNATDPVPATESVRRNRNNDAFENYKTLGVVTHNTTSAVSFDLAGDFNNQLIYNDSSSTIASLTITLPDDAALGQILRYVTKGACTSVTVTGGAVSIGASVTSLAANAIVAWQGVDTGGTWVRIQ